jgi:predicted nucleotidyltransferase
MDDKIIQGKIERSLEIICPLYRENLITDAYIIGSLAKGIIKKESDIDILIINPSFEAYCEELSPDEELENIKKVVVKLKDMGAQFKLIEKEKEFIFKFWYQLYKGELFHIMPQKFFFNSLPHIQISKDIC